MKIFPNFITCPLFEPNLYTNPVMWFCNAGHGKAVTSCVDSPRPATNTAAAAKCIQVQHMHVCIHLIHRLMRALSVCHCTVTVYSCARRHPSMDATENTGASTQPTTSVSINTLNLQRLLECPVAHL